MHAVIGDTEGRVIGMTNALGSSALAEALLDRIDAGVGVEWVLPPDMYEAFTSVHGPLADRAVADGQTAVYVADGLPIDFAVYDDTFVLLGFDSAKCVLAVVAITEDSGVVDWARERFSAYRTTAERVE